MADGQDTRVTFSEGNLGKLKQQLTVVDPNPNPNVKIKIYANSFLSQFFFSNFKTIMAPGKVIS